MINNESAAYEPNTLMITLGKGERTMSPQVNGVDNVTIIFAEDVSTKKSKVSFELRSTVENIALLQAWQNNRADNYIQIIDGENSYICQGAAVTNDPEIETGSDAKISIEFEGEPVKIG